MPTGSKSKNKNLHAVMGIVDGRSKTGIFSRGANVYNGVSKAAHKGGGPQFGRPKKKAIVRRLYGRSN